MRRLSGFLPGVFAGFLLLVLSGLPHLGVTLADADFLAETLVPSTLTRSLRTDDAHAAKPGWSLAAPNRTRSRGVARTETRTAAGRPAARTRSAAAGPAVAASLSALPERAAVRLRLSAPPLRSTLDAPYGTLLTAARVRAPRGGKDLAMAANYDDVRANETKPQEARLHGVPGTGTVRVTRGQNGSIMSITGTWRQSWDDGRHDLSELLQAYREGRAVRYEGPVHDVEGSAGSDATRMEVQLSSVAEYAYDVDAPGGDPEAAPRRTLFNFHPVEDSGNLA